MGHNQINKGVKSMDIAQLFNIVIDWLRNNYIHFTFNGINFEFSFFTFFCGILLLDICIYFLRKFLSFSGGD